MVKNEAQPDGNPDSPVAPYTRRLSDKILVAFHQACDQGELEVAERLLTILEMALAREWAGTNRRRRGGGLVMAHERLWELKHRIVYEER